MKNPLAVNVSTIAGKPGHRLDADVSGALSGLATSGGRVDAETPVAFVGVVETIDGAIQAEGQVSTHWVGECRRCLGPASGEIEVRVRELFERQPTEGETYPVEGDSINLEPMIREAVMLELPVAPLCRSDCAGLCAICGANRNDADCGHTNEVKDHRWAALDQLKNVGN